jgi:hypothetical protein
MGKIFSTPDFYSSAHPREDLESIAYAKLNIDGEVVEVGSDLLLDGLTTRLGREVDVSLDSA